MRPGTVLLAASLVAVLVACCGPATVHGQQMMPFGGSGPSEPSQPTDVFVSSYVDRLMHINDKDYEFEALVFVYLSWKDPLARETEAKNRAKLSADNATELNVTCKMQCQLYPLNQNVPQMGCCDDVWLPYVSFPTLKYLSQDRVMRWGVNLDPRSDAVAWWAIIMGTFIASFDLRAFPFDTQRLHVQMEVPGWAGTNIVLKPSSAGTRMFNTNPDGDALSGWRVMRVGMSRYALPLCQRYTPSSSQPSAADDPAPLVSEFLWSNKTLKQRPGACAAALMAQPQDPSFQVYTMQSLDPENEALAPRNGRPLNVTGVTCTIVIQRYYTQWIMTAILPLIASTWFGFVVFLLPRDSLEARLGAVLTIFVAQAAIQFVVYQDLPNSSYMMALQQMVAGGYVVLILIGVESVLIWYITTYHQHASRHQQHKLARRQFEEHLRDKLAALQARLHALLRQPSRSKSGGGVGALDGMRHISHSLSAVQRTLQDPKHSPRKDQLGSGKSVASSADGDARAIVAAAAVAAADSAAPAAAAAAAGARAGSPAESAKLQEVREVQQQVLALQQELDDLRDKRDQQEAAAAAQHAPQQALTKHGMMFGLPSAVPPPKDRDGSVRGGAAAAAGAGNGVHDSVALQVQQADAEAGTHGSSAAHSSVWHSPWRWCTSMALFLKAVKQDEHLADSLAFRLNKWIGIVQFVAYNLALILVFVVNYLLFRKT